MGDMSIYNSIRSSKVTTGNASQYQGMRTFDDSAQVCPTRSNVSDNGIVGVARDSIQSYAPGCFSALDRMTVESMQRPRYSTYLNATAINDPGIGDDAYAQTDFQYGDAKPAYDTQLGYQYARPVLDAATMNPTYKASDLKSSDTRATAQDKESNYISCFMNHKYDQRPCDASAGGR